MSAAKTVNQRVHELRQRRLAAGLLEVKVWVHRDDAQAIRDYAERKRRARERIQKKEGKPGA